MLIQVNDSHSEPKGQIRVVNRPNSGMSADYFYTIRKSHF